jgi:metal-dependent amidase/aminoacylase/carboxypeptidase family protein
MQRHNLPGKVVLFGTPAEEGGGGKIRLLEAGAYRDHSVDISLITHPGTSADSALTRTAAFSSFKAEYFGKEAHAALRPWDGINALDALVTAYNAVAVLRQQTAPGDIIEAQILNGGLRPNIIHGYSSGLFVVRSASRARRDALMSRVLACFDAGATATGATLKITHRNGYDDHVPNKVLGARYRKAFLALGGRIPVEAVDYATNWSSASTDQGNLSYAMPSISVSQPSFGKVKRQSYVDPFGPCRSRHSGSGVRLRTVNSSVDRTRPISKRLPGRRRLMTWPCEQPRPWLRRPSMS